MADVAFDVVLASPWKNEKTGKSGTSWATVGSAFHNSKGGISLRIKHAVVIVPGVTEIVLQPPREKEEKGDIAF